MVVIHGGRTFDTYEQYLWSLKNREVDIEAFKARKNWREWLAKALGENFEVFVPRMPNPNNAAYEEWKIWFERLAAFLHNDIVLIGHSLGGIFLAKYLSENTFDKKIAAVFLVAAPCSDVCEGEFLKSFELPKSLEHFSNQAKHIYLFFSEDDPVVPFSQMDEYKKALPGAKLISFAHKQHFNQETFSELVKYIKQIYS